MAVFFCIIPAGNHHCRRAVVQAGGVAGGHLAILDECRFQFGQPFQGGIAARGFIGIEDGHLAFPARDLDRDDLGFEFA